MNQYHLDAKETLKRLRSAQCVCVFLPWSEGTKAYKLSYWEMRCKVVSSPDLKVREHDMTNSLLEILRGREREHQVGWLVDL